MPQIQKPTIEGFMALLGPFKYRHDYSTVFRDWVRQFRLMITVGGDGERQQLLSKYSDDLVQAMHAMNVYAMEIITEKIEERGWYDLLGIIYEELVSMHKASGMGQFFTPHELCNLTAAITKVDPEHLKARPRQVHDPTSGSGRNLMAFHAHHVVPLIQQRQMTNTHICYSGIDLDQVCVEMTMLNMAIHGMHGYVVYGDALWPDKTYGVWVVNAALPRFHGQPHIEAVPADQWQGYRLHLKRVAAASEPADPPVSQAVQSARIVGTQLSIF